MSADPREGRSLSEEMRRAAPREHGAWGMLLVPFLAGAGAGGVLGPALLWLLGVALAIFFLRAHLATGLRARRVRRPLPARLPLLIASDALVGAVCGAVLVLLYREYWLLPLGGVAVGLMALDALSLSRRQERSLPAELSGAAALCLMAPAAFGVAGGESVPLAVGLWLMCALYFWPAILYVRMRLARRLHPEEFREPLARLRRALPALAAHAAALLAAGAAAASGLLPPAAIVALVPATARALVGGLRGEGRISVRVLGFMEIVHSLLFAALLIAAVRLGRA